MTDKRYRICADCGKTYNVSVLAQNEKKYICPHCEYKKRRHRSANPNGGKEN